MTPSQTSSCLRDVAASIDASSSPSRSAVASAVRAVLDRLAALDGTVGRGSSVTFKRSDGRVQEGRVEHTHEGEAMVVFEEGGKSKSKVLPLSELTAA